MNGNERLSPMKQTMMNQNEINCLLAGIPIDTSGSEPDERAPLNTKLFRWHVRKIENNGEIYFAA